MAKVPLVVIEAPGKIKRLAALLAEMGLAARVVATGGHVAGFPDDPTCLGVTLEGETPGRDWKPGAKARLLRDIASPDVERVVIATDDDDEGDVIAWDVARLAASVGVPARRLRLGALSRDAVGAGFASLGEITASDAAPGLVRSMVDRVLGIGLSGSTHGCGRVLTPLLALGAAGEFRKTPVDLVLPAKKGGMPFQVRGWLSRDELGRLRTALTSLGLPDLDDEPVAVAPPLAGTGELLVRFAEERGQGVELATRMFQVLYETGRMSYCRAYDAPLPRSALATLARSAGLSAIPAHTAHTVQDHAPGAHPAPHPLAPVPLTTDTGRLVDDDAALVIVGRAQAEAALQEWRAGSSSAWSSWLRSGGLDEKAWSRPMRPVGRVLGWLRRREPGLHAVSTTLSARIVRAMLHHGLGRPSTYAEHAERLMSRQLVVSDGSLSDKGARWLNAAPETLRQASLSHAIEQWCRSPGQGETGERPWEARFRRIFGDLPYDLRDKVTLAMDMSSPGEELASGTTSR